MGSGTTAPYTCQVQLQFPAEAEGFREVGHFSLHRPDQAALFFLEAELGSWTRKHSEGVGKKEEEERVTDGQS